MRIICCMIMIQIYFAHICLDYYTGDRVQEAMDACAFLIHLGLPLRPILELR